MILSFLSNNRTVSQEYAAKTMIIVTKIESMANSRIDIFREINMAFFLSEIETGLHFVGGLEERIYF